MNWMRSGTQLISLHTRNTGGLLGKRETTAVSPQKHNFGVWGGERRKHGVHTDELISVCKTNKKIKIK